MWKNKEEFFIRCGCGDHEHLVSLWFSNDKERYGKKDEKIYQELSLSLKIEEVNLWQRIKNAFLYIFKQRQFWHYGEIHLDFQSEHCRKELDDLIKYLKNVQKEVKTNPDYLK